MSCPFRSDLLDSRPKDLPTLPGLSTRVSLTTERIVAWLDRYYLGHLLRGLSAFAIAWIPTAQEFSGRRGPEWLMTIVEPFADPRWLIVFFGAILLLTVLTQYRPGSPVRRLMRSLGSINGSFAGTLESLGSKLETSPRRKLDDNQCENLCTALLHRIRDYTAVALGATDSPRLRATLAVPVFDEEAKVQCLRVWCYDEPHEVRGYTRIPMEIGGKLAPGAPTSYIERVATIVDDIREIPGPPSNANRTYRSILCFPVPARDGNGYPLAVVSIDADEAEFFSAQRVASDVRPLISPVLSAIGLVLLSRKKKGQPYGFPR